jgi:hypothetical protein
MILKVTFVQPIINNYKRDPQASKSRYKKKRSNLFASVLESTIESKSASLMIGQGINYFHGADPK